jgi:hypothetical protein
MTRPRRSGDALRRAHPDGIDVLLDLASDKDGLANLAGPVRSGATADTTQYLADTAAPESAGLTRASEDCHHLVTP